MYIVQYLVRIGLLIGHKFKPPFIFPPDTVQAAAATFGCCSSTSCSKVVEVVVVSVVVVVVVIPCSAFWRPKKAGTIKLLKLGKHLIGNKTFQKV